MLCEALRAFGLFSRFQSDRVNDDTENRDIRQAASLPGAPKPADRNIMLRLGIQATPKGDERKASGTEAGMRFSTRRLSGGESRIRRRILHFFSNTIQMEMTLKI
jgi:hypothetical protein